MMPHNSMFSLIAALAGLIGIAAFSLWTTKINQFFFFGRTLPRGFTTDPAAMQITQRYSRRIVIGMCSALTAFAALRIVAGFPVLVSFALVCVMQIVAFHLAFAGAHREAGVTFGKRRNAIGDAAASSAAEAAQRVIAVPLLESKVRARSRLSTILLPAASALMAWLIVMAASHMSFALLANAVDANGGSGLEGFGVGVLFAGTLFSLLMRYSARYRTPMAQWMLRTMLLLEWVGVLAIAGTAIAVPMHFAITHTMTRVAIFPVLALAMAYAIYSRGRINQFAPPPVEQNGDELWRWGLFYNNAADPALFIQARTGPGYTLNFGKSLAWPIAAAVFGYFVFLVFLGFHHS
jgi:hypothetical protein